MRDVTHVVYDGKSYIVVSPFEKIDESQLSIVDRLGLAYCRLNSYEWDEILGEPPAVYGHKVLYAKMMAIEEIIGKANTSRCWWKFSIGKTEEEWREWYYKRYLPEPATDHVDYPRQRSDSEERRGNKLKELPALIRALFLKKK